MLAGFVCFYLQKIDSMKEKLYIHITLQGEYCIMVRQQQQSHVENIIQIDFFFLRAVQTLTLHLFTRDNEI